MSTKSETSTEFSPLRARFWPIHNYELKKFLPMSFIMFCILFNYTLLRDTKDTLVVNSAGAGAITFLKLYCVTPAAILFVIIYAKLSNILSKENLFYAIITPFLVFFGAFAFIIYPNLDSLHPSVEAIQNLHASYPRLSGFIDIYAYWSYSVFYVLSEIWGSAMIALLFWQFANQVTRMGESRRFYGLFAVIGNLALILSGQVVSFCSQGIKAYVAEGADAWQTSLHLLMAAVIVMGIAAIGLFWWMHRNVLNDPLYYDEAEQSNKPKKKKEKPSLMESFKIILKSRELGLITILIMAYGVTINLVEVQWKHQLKEFYAGDKGGYNSFMGHFSSCTGLFTILFGIFFGSDILRRVNWFSAAVITPLVIVVGGGFFFGFIICEETMKNLLGSFSIHPVTAATFLGALVVIVSKSVKYCLFDPTKEMAYIPLDDELKVKGKAAVDVIGGRAGKAGGAFVQNILLLLFATKDVVSIAPVTAAVFLGIGFLWTVAVKSLSVKITEAVKNKETQKA